VASAKAVVVADMLGFRRSGESDIAISSMASSNPLRNGGVHSPLRGQHPARCAVVATQSTWTTSANSGRVIAYSGVPSAAHVVIRESSPGRGRPGRAPAAPPSPTAIRSGLLPKARHLCLLTLRSSSIPRCLSDSSTRPWALIVPRPPWRRPGGAIPMS
jgi:hypothetical protein